MLRAILPLSIFEIAVELGRYVVCVVVVAS